MSIQLSGCTQLTSFGKAKLISLCFNTQLLSQGTESSTSQPCTVSKLARATEETGRKSRMICSYIKQSASITSCSLNRVPVSLSHVAQEFLFTLEAVPEVSGSLCQEPSYFRFILETCGPLTPSRLAILGGKSGTGSAELGVLFLPSPVVYTLPKLLYVRLASPFCVPAPSPF